jgi:hypothetical protein
MPPYVAAVPSGLTCLASPPSRPQEKQLSFAYQILYGHVNEKRTGPSKQPAQREQEAWKEVGFGPSGGLASTEGHGNLEWGYEPGPIASEGAMGCGLGQEEKVSMGFHRLPWTEEQKKRARSHVPGCTYNDKGQLVHKETGKHYFGGSVAPKKKMSLTAYRELRKKIDPAGSY